MKRQIGEFKKGSLSKDRINSLNKIKYFKDKFDKTGIIDV